MYLGVFEAVRWRLEGNNPHQAPPLGPFQQVDLQGATVPTDWAKVQAHMSRETSVDVAGIRIPIVSSGKVGTSVDEYPLITFDIVGLRPDYSRYVTTSRKDGEETHIERFPQSVGDVKENGEVVVTSPRMARIKEAAAPFNYEVEIRLYTRDFAMSALMLKHFYDVLPTRTFLKVSMADGTSRAWRAEQSHYHMVNSKQAEGMAAVGLVAEYCHVIDYDVFGFSDNTDTWIYTNLIRSRAITTRSMQNE